jgi:hypothetical protein
MKSAAAPEMQIPSALNDIPSESAARYCYDCLSLGERPPAVKGITSVD